MKKLLTIFLSIITIFSIISFTGCSKDKTITVCASELPHADVLNNCVKSILKEKGYTLNVKVLDWTIQNDGVANGDYDANYFQHVPYLETYTGSTKLFAACKVHYEPLSIYVGKASKETFTEDVQAIKAGTKTANIIICDDVSNGIRALQLLEAKGFFSKEDEGANFPYNETGEEFSFEGSTWTNSNGNLKIKLISEETLVTSMADYEYACLPCNTAYTGRVNDNKKVAKEDDPNQVALKANIICAREDDYKNNSTYKAKIDALVDAMLSKEVSDYFKTKYLGTMTCDATSQIDLRK